MFHPSERKSDGELTKACRNVFEVAKASHKQEKTGEQNSDYSDGDDEN